MTKETREVYGDYTVMRICHACEFVTNKGSRERPVCPRCGEPLRERVGRLVYNKTITKNWWGRTTEKIEPEPTGFQIRNFKREARKDA